MVIFSKKDKKSIAEAYKNGVLLKDIGNTYGLCATTIYDYLKRTGVICVN